MCERGTMQSPIDFLNKRVEVVPNLGRPKRSYKPAYAKRERKSSSTASYLIVWVTPLTIKHSLIRTKSCYIHGSFNHFIFKYKPPQGFKGLRRNFKSWLRPEFDPGDKTKTDSIQTKTDETRTEKYVQIVQVGFESYFHPLKSFRSSPGWA